MASVQYFVHFQHICLLFLVFCMHTVNLNTCKMKSNILRGKEMTLDPSEYNKLLPQIRTLVNKCVKKNMADGFLFSAGTDTQIIAYEAVKYKPDIPCLTLAFKHG